MKRRVFRPRRLGHANLWVTDLAKSEVFYNKTCGLAVEFTEPGLKASFMGTGNTPHDLGMIETTGGQPRYGRDGLLQLPAGIGLAPGLNHLAWELENEVELVEAWKQAKAESLTIHMTVDHQVAHSVYMPDPDGNQIEFYCDTVKDWRRVLHGEMDLITSSWDPEKAEPSPESRYDLNPEIRTVDEAPVHPRRVTHAVLITRDPDRMVEYYQRVAGMDLVHRDKGKGYDVAFLRGTAKGYRYHLGICAGRDSSYHHVSFELAGPKAVDEAERKMRAAGINIERSVDSDWKRSFFLIDPDGLRSEYMAYRRDGFGSLESASTTDVPYLM